MKKLLGQDLSKRAPLTDADGEVHALTADDMEQFRPAAQVLPDALQETLCMRRRGPQKTLTKVSTTIRFDADLLLPRHLKMLGRLQKSGDAESRSKHKTRGRERDRFHSSAHFSWSEPHWLRNHGLGTCVTIGSAQEAAS